MAQVAAIRSSRAPEDTGGRRGRGRPGTCSRRSSWDVHAHQTPASRSTCSTPRGPPAGLRRPPRGHVRARVGSDLAPVIRSIESGRKGTRACGGEGPAQPGSREAPSRRAELRDGRGSSTDTSTSIPGAARAHQSVGRQPWGESALLRGSAHPARGGASVLAALAGTICIVLLVRPAAAAPRTRWWTLQEGRAPDRASTRPRETRWGDLAAHVRGPWRGRIAQQIEELKLNDSRRRGVRRQRVARPAGRRRA